VRSSIVTAEKRRAFTLIELLVVIAIVGVLTSMLLSAVSSAKAKAHRVKCASNLRQLYFANALHAGDYGYYVPAASDMFSANLNRWHGGRTSQSEPFDASEGPLAPYLGKTGEIRACPSFHGFETSTEGANAFEASCGGYGYNAMGVGSQAYSYGYTKLGLERGASYGSLAQPAKTVMFCDAAFPQPYGNPKYLIEYSFAEPYHALSSGTPPSESDSMSQASIHFRHQRKANVVWCDGHVSAETMDAEYSDKFTEFNVGWFGPEDNSLFDPH